MASAVLGCAFSDPESLMFVPTATQSLLAVPRMPGWWSGSVGVGRGTALVFAAACVARAFPAVMAPLWASQQATAQDGALCCCCHCRSTLSAGALPVRQACLPGCRA